MERQDMTLYPSLIHELINGLNLLSDYVSNKKIYINTNIYPFEQLVLSKLE